MRVYRGCLSKGSRTDEESRNSESTSQNENGLHRETKENVKDSGKAEFVACAVNGESNRRETCWPIRCVVRQILIFDPLGNTCLHISDQKKKIGVDGVLVRLEPFRVLHLFGRQLDGSMSTTSTIPGIPE